MATKPKEVKIKEHCPQCERTNPVTEKKAMAFASSVGEPQNTNIAPSTSGKDRNWGMDDEKNVMRDLGTMSKLYKEAYKTKKTTTENAEGIRVVGNILGETKPEPKATPEPQLEMEEPEPTRKSMKRLKREKWAKFPGDPEIYLTAENGKAEAKKYFWGSIFGEAKPKEDVQGVHGPVQGLNTKQENEQTDPTFEDEEWVECEAESELE